MTFRPKSFKEAKESFKPLSRKTGFKAEKAPSLSASRASQDSSGSAGPSKRPRKVLRGYRRSKTTIDGDPAKDVKRECDSIISQIIAIQDEDCFICGIPASQTDLHPGHFITRKVLALRWHLECNIRPQCNRCNSDHNEHPSWYRSMLVLDIGESNVVELERVAKKNPRVEYPELLTIRDDLQVQLKRLIGRIR